MTLGSNSIKSDSLDILSFDKPFQDNYLFFSRPSKLAAALQADSLASELPGQRINGSQTPFSQFCLFPNVVFKLFQGI